jgi:hypothetical protein
LQDGRLIQPGRFANTPEGARGFAEELRLSDDVALQATGNTWAIATPLAIRAGGVVVFNPSRPAGSPRGQGEDRLS